MNFFPMALVLGSAFMHAGWNLIARRYMAEPGFFFKRMVLVIVLVGLLPAAVSEILTHSLNIKAWLCVVGSGFCCGVYFFCLAEAYTSSDFTTVYPVSRALPVFLVGIGDVLRGRYPTEFGWIGMLLVISGCFLAPLYSFRDFHVRSYFNRQILWMVLTALGTVGYTLLDKMASEVVLQGPGTAARYEYVFFLISYLAYGVFLRISQKGKNLSISLGWGITFFSACLSFGAYWLVLWAYQLSQHASYIVAFRQFSIVIGVISAFAIYKEKGVFVRLLGTFLITLGLLLIGLWGG
jgi:drug/metabolite transporter (DMT)-like permease